VYRDLQESPPAVSSPSAEDFAPDHTSWFWNSMRVRMQGLGRLGTWGEGRREGSRMHCPPHPGRKAFGGSPEDQHGDMDIVKRGQVPSQAL
jgi:hypothetical protein